MMSLSRSLFSEEWGFLTAVPFPTPWGKSGREIYQQKKGGERLGRGLSMGHTLGENHIFCYYSLCHHHRSASYSCSVQGRTGVGLCQMTIVSCDCLNITEEKVKGHVPRDTEWAGGEGNLLSAFRTGSFCHSRGSLMFDLTIWTLENVPRVPLGRQNSSGEPWRRIDLTTETYSP